MKLHHLMLVAVLMLTVFAGETFAQQRLFGNGRLLRKLRDDLTGRRSKDEKPVAKATASSKAKAKAKSKTPTPAAKVSKTPTPASTAPRSIKKDAWPATKNYKAPTLARPEGGKPNLQIPKTYKAPRLDDLDGVAEKSPRNPKAATRSDKKQTLGFGMLLETKRDKLVVTRIDPKGNANKSGLKVGDEVFKAAGIKLTSMEEFNQITEVLRDGDQIEVEFSRRGKKGKELVMLGEGPKFDVESVDKIEPAEVPVSADNSFPRSSKTNYDFVPKEKSSASSVLNNQPVSSYRIPTQPRQSPKTSAERIEYERALEQQRREIEQLNSELRRLRNQTVPVAPPAEGNSVLQIPDLNGPGR